MLQRILLKYLRNFPLDYGKNRISKLIDFSKLPESLTYKNGDNIEFNLDLREYQMKQIYLYNRYEKNSLRHLLRYLNDLKKDNLRIFDVGANIGFYTLYLSKNSEKKHGIVHSFEPNPVTLNVLQKHVKQNNVTNCTINPFGLSNAPQEIEISYSPKNLGAASVFGNSGTNKALIKLDTLDHYCKLNNISEIDIIKVDIEGSELNFLKGGTEVINQSKNLLIMMEIVDENCKQAGYSAEELFSYMMKLGFKSYVPKGWPFGLKQIESCPRNFHDNIFFIK